MVNKKISPVTFSDESVERNEQVGVNSINRAAPVDPDSGSGSGSGSGSVSGIGGAEGHGVIWSDHGGYWDASCNFSWYAVSKYSTMVGSDGLRYDTLELSLQLVDVRVTCSGVLQKVGSTGYQPWSQSLLFNTDFDTRTIEDNLTSRQTFKYASPMQEFYVSILSYGDDGTPSVQNRVSETKAVLLEVVCDVNPNFYTSKKPDITFLSCHIG